MTTSDPWDSVPDTVNSRSEKLNEHGSIGSEAEPVELDAIPATMIPGAITRAAFAGRPVVLVGTVPTGFTVTLCPTGWATLQQWKLTTFRVSRRSLYVGGTGRASGFAAARFLLGASGNHTIRHRNGNPFDIRLVNIVAISRGLIRQAGIETARRPGYVNPDVRWGNGRRHSGVPLKTPSARQRVADALALRDPG